jgi:pumilio family protein 6
MSKLIRYCPQIHDDLIQAINPHLLSLLEHADASQPLGDFYEMYATNKERRTLVRGLYPREVKVFDGKVGDKVLEEVLVGLGDGAGRNRVIDEVERTVNTV